MQSFSFLKSADRTSSFRSFRAARGDDLILTVRRQLRIFFVGRVREASSSGAVYVACAERRRIDATASSSFSAPIHCRRVEQWPALGRVPQDPGRLDLALERLRADGVRQALVRPWSSAERTIARTRQPRRSSSSVTTEPTSPLAPVTTTVIPSNDGSLLSCGWRPIGSFLGIDSSRYAACWRRNSAFASSISGSSSSSVA